MDAKSCMRNAQRCIDTAQQCDDAKRQAVFFDLARAWLALGIAYEKRRILCRWRRRTEPQTE
jgi:hypothetical protein